MKILILLSVSSILLGAAPRADSWPGFRGDGSNRAAARGLPLEWADDRNLAWRVSLDGYGQSSPVVWRDRVYVTSVVGPNKETLVTSAYRLRDGERLWTDRRVSSFPVEAHDRMAKAAPTPAVDAEGVYVFFESGDLAAFDHDGRLRWSRALQEEGENWGGRHGIGGSPVLSRGKLFVHAAPSGPGLVAAFDVAEGKELWRRRPAPQPSFSTPTLVTINGREALLTTAGGGAIAYDAATGGLIFERAPRAGRGYAVPSATVAGDIVVVASSEAGGTHAFRLSNPAETLWTAAKATTEFGSPAVDAGKAYLVNPVGVVYVLDLATGRPLATARIPSGCWASPLAAGGALYFFGVDGRSVVFPQGIEAGVRRENILSIDGRVYGAAAVDGSILIRSGSELLRLSNTP